MANFIKGKTKILFLCLFVLLTCTACSSPRATDGKTKLDEIIASEEVTVRKDQVNISEIQDKDMKKKYKDLADDEEITIEPMTFGEAFNDGWFDGLIVWPLAQIINKIASVTDAGWGIILTTDSDSCVYIYPKITDVGAAHAGSSAGNAEDPG